MSDFWVALPLPKKIGDEIEVHGIRARIAEEISHQEYLDIWAFKGFPTEGIALNPRGYYRCEKLDAEVS